MAHNISMVGGKAAIAYYGTKPWHNLGTEVNADQTADEMLIAAGLNWQVEKRNINGSVIGAQELVRLARPNYTEVDIQLGRCTKAYHPLQNDEAFKIFDMIAGVDKATFHTAGTLGDGETIWVLAKLPETIKVKGDDIVDKFMLLSNTHNGSEAISVKFTPIRVVCQNTLSMAMSDGNASIRIRHTANMETKLASLPNLFGITNSEFDEVAEVYKAMANKQINTAGLNKFLEALMPMTTTQLQKKTVSNKIPTRWEAIIADFENPEFAESRGTLWSLYNSLARFTDYVENPKSKDATSRLKRVWFGAGADLKIKALEVAKQLLVA